jgi:hypothetical protein
MGLLAFPTTAYLVTEAAASLLDGNITAGTVTLTGTWPAGYTGRLKIIISSVSGHTDCAGSLLIGGTETVTFTAAGTKITTTNLTANPAVVCTGLDCHCHITVITTGGADIMAETLTLLKVRHEPEYVTIRNPDGSYTTYNGYCMVVNSTIGNGDKIRINSTDYHVKRIEPQSNLKGTEIYRIVYF